MELDGSYRGAAHVRCRQDLGLIPDTLVSSNLYLSVVRQDYSNVKTCYLNKEETNEKLTLPAGNYHPVLD